MYFFQMLYYIFWGLRKSKCIGGTKGKGAWNKQAVRKFHSVEICNLMGFIAMELPYTYTYIHVPKYVFTHIHAWL